jgi:hypothetical protein
MGFYTDLAAHIEHRAGRTAGETARADMLAERDQEAIDFYPVATRQDGFERRCRLYRRPRVNITPAIGDPVNMGIHGNVGLATRNAEHEVGTFGTSPVPYVGH